MAILVHRELEFTAVKDKEIQNQRIGNDGILVILWACSASTVVKFPKTNHNACAIGILHDVSVGIKDDVAAFGEGNVGTTLTVSQHSDFFVVDVGFDVIHAVFDACAIANTAFVYRCCAATVACAIEHQATSVVNGCWGGIVASGRISATQARSSVTTTHATLVNRETAVGNAIASRARGVVPIAYPALVIVNARAVVEGSSVVKVARRGIGTAQAGSSVTAAYAALVVREAAVWNAVATCARGVVTAAHTTLVNREAAVWNAVTTSKRCCLRRTRHRHRRPQPRLQDRRSCKPYIRAEIFRVTNAISVDVEVAVAIANAQGIHSSNTVVLGIADSVFVEVTERTIVEGIADSIVVAVVVAIFTRFILIACAVLVHVDAVVFVVTNAVGI